MRKLICMSFDGDYVTESPIFKITKEAWHHSGNLGSKWYFYPFHFVTSKSGKTIMDSPELLEWAKGRRVQTVQKIFKFNYEMNKHKGIDMEEFALSMIIWERNPIKRRT